MGQGISRMREFDLGPDLRIALGPAARSAASTGRTHDRTRPQYINVTKTLAKGETSTHDPIRKLMALEIREPYDRPAAQTALEVQHAQVAIQDKANGTCQTHTRVHGYNNPDRVPDLQ